MTQNVLDYSLNPSGIQLMDTYLAGMADNQLTTHSGISRPSYAQAGTFWIDTAVTPWVLKQFTGTNDVVVGTLDQTNLYFTATRATADASGNNITTTYAKLSGTQTINANNTFSGNNSFSNKITGNISGHADLDAQLTANNTFTGNNNFTASSMITGTPNLKNTALATNGTTPSGDTAFPIHFMANDESFTGYIRSRQSSNGTYSLDLACSSKVTGTQNWSEVQICVDSAGNAYATAPTPSSATDNSGRIATTSWVRNHRCTTAATTSSTASVDAPAYVVENYKGGSSQWYRVWSDGWIEQGGVFGSISLNGNGTQTLHKAFKSAGYTLLLTAGNDATSSGFDTGTQGCAVYTRKTTTNFKWRMYHFGNQYYATQMVWYACGY